MDSAPIQTTSFPGSRWERLLAGSILLFAVLFFGAASYPTLEGWECWTTWKQDGPLAFFTHPDGRSRLADHADRPLHLLPSLAGWLLPGDFDTGVMLLGGLITLTRGLLLLVLCRLGNIQGPVAWLVFLVGLMEPVWTGSGFERFHAAQVAFLGLLAGLCFGLGYERTGNKWLPVAGLLVLLASFMTYQGQFLAALMAPLPFWIAGSKSRCRALCITLLPGCLLYLVYYFGISKVVSTSYVQTNVKDPLGPESIERIVRGVTAGGLRAHLAFVAVAVASLVAWWQKGQTARAGLLGALFVGAPLAGLIYYSNLNFLGDPERLLFATTGWLTVMVTACGCGGAVGNTLPVRGLLAGACVVCLWAGSYHPYRVLRYAHLQREVLAALENSGVQWGPETKVLVKDPTQILGGTYTFLHPHYLNTAWQALGHPGRVSLCVDAPKEGHPGHTAVFCEDCNPSDYTDFVEMGLEKSRHPLGDHWVARRLTR